MITYLNQYNYLIENEHDVVIKHNRDAIAPQAG